MKAPPTRLVLAFALIAAAAAAVVVALLAVGGPGAGRLERMDELRVRQAVELVNAIERHRIFTGQLPDTLETVRPTLSGQAPIRDPETGQPYDYEALGGGRFRVCVGLSAPEAALEHPGPIRMAESRRIATMTREPDGRVCWRSADAPG